MVLLVWSSFIGFSFSCTALTLANQTPLNVSMHERTNGSIGSKGRETMPHSLPHFVPCTQHTRRGARRAGAAMGMGNRSLHFTYKHENKGSNSQGKYSGLRIWNQLAWFSMSTWRHGQSRLHSLSFVLMQAKYPPG